MTRRDWLARLGPPVLLVLLLGLTALGTVLAFRREHDRERNERASSARPVAAAIEERMQEAAELLEGAAALWTARPDATPREFHDFLVGQDTAGRFPGVLAIVHAQSIPAADVDRYVRATNRETAASGLDYPRFRVHPAPAKATKKLLVVDRVEPVARQSRVFGLNLLADPGRRGPARRALREGRPAAGPPLEPLRFRGPGLAVMLMVPVTAPDPRDPAPGLVYGTFRMDLLMRGVVGQLPRGAAVEIYDLGLATMAGDGPPTPFRVAGRSSAPLRDDDATVIERLQVGGRRWAVVFRQPHVDVPALDRAAPWIALTAGLLGSLLAAALVQTLVSSRARAMRLAEQMTGELREREAQLQATNAELEHFAYLASHDLQEPLRTITSYAGLLQRRSADQLDERSMTWLRFISEGAARMSDLIADLLEYSRTGQRGERAPVALDAAWDTAVANVADAIQRTGAQVTRGSLPVVEGRERELVSLLQNLISNGLKYRSDTAPRIHADAEHLGDRWQIRVSDNGIGIDPRFHDRVFALFQRLHTGDEYPGTGMGLAIVRKIAESSGGTVRVESLPGRGSTFVIELPAQREAA